MSGTSSSLLRSIGAHSKRTKRERSGIEGELGIVEDICLAHEEGRTWLEMQSEADSPCVAMSCRPCHSDRLLLPPCPSRAEVLLIPDPSPLS